mmetsp:Transcript_61283/g.68614  ORF Transcript_61283/g.68614 Transcript_61283/m.68614 type:complete len:638 (-) Transcript_61283:124-2037(-)
MKNLIGFIHVVSYLALSISSVLGESSVVNNEKNDNGGTKQDPTTIGLAIQGGGFITALSGAATIRGFQLQNIVDDSNDNKQQLSAMERFDYISGSSGGILPTVTYCYASDNIKTTELFESDRGISDLGKLTTKDLKRFSSKKSFFYRLNVPVVVRNGPRLFWATKIKPKLIKRLPWLFKDTLGKVWSSIIHKSIFKHFGIKNNVCISKAPIRKGMRTIPMITATFFYPKKGGINLLAYYGKAMKLKINPPRSFTTLDLDKVGKSLSNNDNVTVVPIIITPNEVTFGMQQELTVNYNTIDELNLTSEVDPIQYPIASSHPSKWGTKKYLMSVTNAAAMGANMLAFTSPLASTIEAPIKEDGTSRLLTFGDGGTNDVLGIAGLVQHRVRKIVVSISYTTDYIHNFEGSNSTSDDGHDMLLNWLDPPNYGGDTSSNNNPIVSLANFFGFDKEGSLKSLNHMFSNGEARLGELKRKFNSLYLEGNPLVATLKDLEVIDNPFWGTTAGDMVDLTIIFYANVPHKFSESVKVDGKRLETDKNGFFTDPELSGVPNLKMENENEFNLKNGYRIAAYTPKQVNMVRILGSWIIQEGWDGLRGHDGQVKFEGFKDLFEGKPNRKNSDNDDDEGDNKTGEVVVEATK